MLKIGVSACFMYPDADRKVFGPKTLSYIENDMAAYLSQFGVLPILIPDLADEKLYEFVSFVDGFVFQGGTDLAPESYGERPIANGRWLGDIRRDKYELHLLKLATDSGKPIFGICRGMQLINVFFGGSLYQDTTTQRSDAHIHRDAEIYDNLHHDISIVPGTLLNRVYQSKSITVNSVHHQSVKKLGNDLNVMAESVDGVIEAIEHREKSIFGVQWHPEFSHTLAGKVANASLLYQYFLDQVRQCKG